MHGGFQPTNLVRKNQNWKILVTKDVILEKFLTGELSGDERFLALNPSKPDTSELLLTCAPSDYSASAIAKAVEDCDAQLLGLSVSDMRDERGWPVIAICVNRRATDGIERSLSRYGYETIMASAPPDSEERIRARDRVNELLHYLEI